MKKLRAICIIVSGVFSFSVASYWYYGAIIGERSSYGQSLAVFGAAYLLGAATLLFSSLWQKSSRVGMAVYMLPCLWFWVMGINKILIMPRMFLSITILLIGLSCALFQQKWENEKFVRLLFHMIPPAVLIVIGFLRAVDPGP